jgi:hypothetical protein
MDCRRERDHITAASAAYLNIALERTGHPTGLFPVPSVSAGGLSLTAGDNAEPLARLCANGSELRSALPRSTLSR